MKKILALFTLVSILLVAANANSDMLTYELKANKLTELGFSDYFPQLYVFNARGQLFFISGGMEGDAIHDLQVLMSNLDEEKISRLKKRPSLAKHVKQQEIFQSLPQKIQQPGLKDLFGKGKLLVLSIILSTEDYTHCKPCKKIEEEMQKLSGNESIISVLLVERKATTH